MNHHQQTYHQLVRDLESVQQTLTQSVPDWDSISALKKPLVAIQAAQEASHHITTSTQLLKALMENFHLRLCELEAHHGQ